MLSSASKACKRLSAPVLTFTSHPFAPFCHVPLRSIASRTASRPLPAAGTYNSRRVRRAAEFGPPTGVSVKARQRQKDKEAKQRNSYDNPWTAANEQQRTQRTAEQPNNRTSQRTTSSYGRARGEDERQSSSRGRGGGRRDDGRRGPASKQASNASARGHRHRREQSAQVAAGDRGRSDERMEDEDEYEVRREEKTDDNTDRPNRSQRRSSLPCSPRTPKSSRTRSARPQRTERATAADTVEAVSKPPRGTRLRRTQSAPPTVRQPPAHSNSSIPRTATARHSTPAARDSVPDKSLRFDGQTYAMQRADHLSEQMAESYRRLASETHIPLASSPTSSSVALLVSPTGRLCMRWGGGGGKKSTHAVQAGFMLRAARKMYERGEAVKDLPLVRALAHALPGGKLPDLPTTETDTANGQRSKRSSGQHYFDKLTVMDATAGLCRDAAVPLFAGAEVYAVERNPAIYALVRHDVDRRLSEPSVARERLSRLHPVLGESLAIMRAMAAGESTGVVPVPDVIMIDVWTDDNPHINDFKARQIARMLRQIDSPTKPNQAGNEQHSASSARSGESGGVAAVGRTEDDVEDDAAADVLTVARRVQLQQRESALLAEARRAAKRCVVVKRLKSASSKTDVLEAERTLGAVAMYRGGMFEYVVYRASNKKWEAEDAAAEAAVGLAEDGIDPVVDTSVDAAIAVAEQRRDA